MAGIDRHLVPAGLQRMADVLQRDPLHVRAEIAGPDELDVGVEHRDVVAHRALRQQHDPGRPLLADEVRHRRRRAGKIGFRHHVGRALRMREDRHVRVIFAQPSTVRRCGKFAPRKRPVIEPSQRPSARNRCCSHPPSRVTIQLSG